jgi:hypothetical protein
MASQQFCVHHFESIPFILAHLDCLQFNIVPQLFAISSALWQDVQVPTAL